MFDCVLFLYLCLIVPKLLLDRLKGKRHPGLMQRLGFSLPDPKGRPVIWIHAVSVGEVRSAEPLFSKLKKERPDAFFLITTTTMTGQAQARVSLQSADAFRYLPLDFRWIVARFAKKLRPKLFCLIESDFWPNLLRAIQSHGGKTVLVSGKLSSRSSRRFRLFSPFARSLFRRLDLLLVQDLEQKNRFAPFVPPEKLHIGGNLKFDLTPKLVSPLPWKTPLPIVTLASTHAPEEELLLNALSSLDLFLFIAPRHPERFEEVASWFGKKKIPFVRWSSRLSPTTEKVLLVDTMGELATCYAHSQLAIVGGSFIPSIGGHNIFEPALYHTPVLFGPYMQGQKEMKEKTLAYRAGEEATLATLPSQVEAILADPLPMRQAAAQMVTALKGASECTVAHLRALL